MPVTHSLSLQAFRNIFYVLQSCQTGSFTYIQTIKLASWIDNLRTAYLGSYLFILSSLTKISNVSIFINPLKIVLAVYFCPLSERGTEPVQFRLTKILPPSLCLGPAHT